jgi:hypothetical protein
MRSLATLLCTHAQVALLVVLAQAGCFVPARFMSLSPFSRLFTRMGTGDSIETNSSSFMVEMQEVAHILQHAGPRSLVVVDEVGGGLAQQGREPPGPVQPGARERVRWWGSESARVAPAMQAHTITRARGPACAAAAA